MSSVSPAQPPVHYGCHEFRDDSERMIQGRAHPELERLYCAHLACCVDCQRYHHRLEAMYRRTRKLAPLDSFARDREFAAILARSREPARSARRGVASLSVGVLAFAAAILAFALIVPGFGARLFRPPAVAELDLRHSDAPIHYDAVHIPMHRGLGHQAQGFARVIGVSLGNDPELHDADGRPTTGDSLTVGTRISTGEAAVQVAFVGRMIANFQPHTVARWNSATATLVELGLVSGMLAIRYDRRPGDPILQVRTPTALVRVLGTVFTVAVDAGGGTTVAVLRGKVEVLDPENGRSLAEVEAGFRYDVAGSSYRDVGRREVAAALPVSEHGELQVSISEDGELIIEERSAVLGQIPATWTVPGLSDDPAQRTLDRVLDPDPLHGPSGPEGELDPAPSRPGAPSQRAAGRVEPNVNDDGKAATLELIDRQLRRERERKGVVEGRLERCRALQSEPETRFRAARCLGDFMKEFGDQPEAVEGLLLLGTLRMDFAHDYQSAARNFEEFLRRAPRHPKAELARYMLMLAAIEAGYIDDALQRGRTYLRHYPDGQYVGRILQRFPELKSEI
jgi:ferric-dicitrate binding protein FerR (iron transport regulator)